MSDRPTEPTATEVSDLPPTTLPRAAANVTHDARARPAARPGDDHKTGAADESGSRGASGAPLTQWTTERINRNIRQFARFGAVGASGVVVNLVVFNLTMWTWAWLSGHQGGDLPRLAEYLANGAGFAVSVLSNYVINRRWTFRSTASKRREMPRFYLVSAIAYAVNLLVFHLCRVQFELTPNLSQLIAIACVMPINFVFNKLWSFR